MTMLPAYSAPFALALAAFCAPAQAATWQICDIQLHVTEVVKRPTPKLQAQVLKARPASPSVECPEEGAVISFIPETADDQATLPRRKWPGKGQAIRIKYRYLDGICKGDGNDYPCRIEHYPFVAR
ncbi:hypothetical protein [Pseudomonas sp. Z3-8]|uniref:hypothetical protein n=1 Tax=Pseudomonas sp. Z3-8 TaxID=2817412 RepID=UPI003DAA4C78